MSSNHCVKEDHIDEQILSNLMITQNMNFGNDKDDSFEDIITKYFSRSIDEVDTFLRKADDGHSIIDQCFSE